MEVVRFFYKIRRSSFFSKSGGVRLVGQNVLIITESFPPINDIAARRFGDLTPYFADHGWQPWILTTGAPGPLPVRIPESQINRVGHYPHFRPSSPAQSAEANGSNSPTRVRFGAAAANCITKTIRPMLRSVVDGTGWRLNVVHPGNFTWYRQTVQLQKSILKWLPTIDIVLGSFRPAGALSIAAHLSKVLRVPWVAEIRDLAALRPDRRNFLAEHLNRALERHLLRTAAGFITVSNTLARIIAAEYQRPTTVVYNGWDEELGRGSQTGMESVHRPLSACAEPVFNSDAIEVCPDSYLYYAGWLYPHRMPSAVLILDAMSRFPDLHFVVRSLGPPRLEQQLQREAARRGLVGRLHLLPPCDPDIVSAESTAALANVVLEELDCNHESGRGTLTGKFLKLLPFRPVVLAVARPDSDIGPILDRTRKGRLCSTANEIVDFLHAVGRLPSQFEGDAGKIPDYSTRSQVTTMCRFFEAMLESQPPENRFESYK